MLNKSLTVVTLKSKFYLIKDNFDNNYCAIFSSGLFQHLKQC